MTEELHRTTSNKSTVGQFDGHVDGHLNCIALRHGWSRKFSLSPVQIATLDYATLEAILELNTLKLRTSQLRIFIEHPPDSGTYSKIRFWKNDTSLQSVLVKNFFEARMRAGIAVTLEIRDGHDREDALSVKSAIGINGSHITLPSLSRTGASTKDWLRRRGLNRSTTNMHGNGAVPTTPVEDEDEDAESMAPPQPQPQPPRPRPSRARALMVFLGFAPKPAPKSPLPKTDEEIADEQRAEEAVLRKRGWLPPVLRRMASKRSNRTNNTAISKTSSRMRVHPENPFFSASERNLARPRTRTSVQTQNNHDSVAVKRDDDGEEMEVVVVPGVAALEAAAGEVDDVQISGETSSRGTPQPNRWLRFRGSSTDVSGGSPDKGKQKQNALTGATVVRKPMDAFQTGRSDEIDD